MRRHLLIGVLLSALFTLTTGAQETPPATEAILLENDFIRVTQVTLPASAAEKAHNHPDRLLYFLDSGEVRMTTEGEPPTVIDAQANHRFWQRAGRTAFASEWPAPVRFLSFEITGRPQGGLDLSLDPATQAPGENEVIFENEVIRVVQTITPPAGGGALHTHGPMAVCSLTAATLEITSADGTSRMVELKPGTVIWSGPVAHQVRTLGSTASHLLHIEFK